MRIAPHAHPLLALWLALWLACPGVCPVAAGTEAERDIFERLNSYILATTLYSQPTRDNQQTLVYWTGGLQPGTGEGKVFCERYSKQCLTEHDLKRGEADGDQARVTYQFFPEAAMLIGQMTDAEKARYTQESKLADHAGPFVDAVCAIFPRPGALYAVPL